MMDLRKWEPVRHNRLPESLLFISNDVSRIQQQRLGQPGQRTSSPIRRYHGLPERSLVNPLLYRPSASRRSALVSGMSSSSSPGNPKATLAFSALGSQPTTNAGTIAW